MALANREREHITRLWTAAKNAGATHVILIRKRNTPYRAVNVMPGEDVRAKWRSPTIKETAEWVDAILDLTGSLEEKLDTLTRGDQVWDVKE